jgi:hypothetical protein
MKIYIQKLTKKVWVLLSLVDLREGGLQTYKIIVVIFKLKTSFPVTSLWTNFRLELKCQSVTNVLAYCSKKTFYSMTPTNDKLILFKRNKSQKLGTQKTWQKISENN